MASLPPDPWKALGIDKTADKSEIRAAYKKLVLKCHPDKVQDAALKAQKQDEFQKVQQAYELLNDDTERVKYEEQVKLMELRRQAAMLAKNAPNSSASRSSPRQYEIRTAEPRHKTSSTPSGGAKVYAYASVHSRSHEEMPSRYSYEDVEKHARRSASFRDEERRDKEKDDRRRRKDEDDFRIKERLREKEREVKEREERRAERKRNEKERDKDRRRGVEERNRRHASPYIEDDSEDQQTFPPKPEKKRSSSNKPPYEGRERERERPREKSSTSRRPPSPHVDTVEPTPAAPAPDQHPEYWTELNKAASYIERSRRQDSFTSSRGPGLTYTPPVVPTPPPADPLDEDNRNAARAAGRRSSHEASKSREKLPPTSRSPYNVVESSSPKSGRSMPPQLHKSHTSPLSGMVPGMEASSPPRQGINRSSTTQEYSSSPHVPPLARQHTWGHSKDYYPVEDSDDDHHQHSSRRRRGSRRTRSPEPTMVHSYKVSADGTKTTKMDPHYPYGESPNSRRYVPPEAYGHHAGGPYPDYIKVKEAKSYTPNDVKYSETPYNVSYVRDPYGQTAYA